MRLAALREVMADAGVDAVWFARGGYGSNRIAEAAATDHARMPRDGKLYLGYSDAGFLLAAFHRAGLDVAHGPMPQDVLREGGDAAVHSRIGLDHPARPGVARARPQRTGDGVQPDRACRACSAPRSSPTSPAANC